VGRLILEEPRQDFVRGFLLPFYGWAPELQKAVMENLVEAYTWPIGIVTRWLRTAALGTPGVLSRVGLGTFIDPQQDGGFLNGLARERRTAAVERVVLDGREYLLYKAPKPDVALVRATTADEIGNLSMEQEAMYGSVLAFVQAAKAHPGGLVIAQVLRVVTLGEIHPKHVVVPGPLVDYVVVARRGTEVEKYHWQTASFDLNPIISGDVPYRVAYEPAPLTADKAVARRVVLELVKLIGALGRPVVVNLGIGIPALAADVIREERLDDFIHLTVESGPWGGYAPVSYTHLRGSHGPLRRDPHAGAVRPVRGRRHRRHVAGLPPGRCRGQREPRVPPRPAAGARRLPGNRYRVAEGVLRRRLHGREEENRCRELRPGHRRGRPHH
jgi:Acyl CoA:acetate/3-ketoacid CoA transferase